MVAGSSVASLPTESSDRGALTSRFSEFTACDEKEGCSPALPLDLQDFDLFWESEYIGSGPPWDMDGGIADLALFPDLSSSVMDMNFHATVETPNAIDTDLPALSAGYNIDPISEPKFETPVMDHRATALAADRNDSTEGRMWTA